MKCDECANHSGCIEYGWKPNECKMFEPIVQTNEEWLRQASTEELAELLFHIFGQGVIFGETHEEVPMFPDDEVITMSVFHWWLKENHT